LRQLEADQDAKIETEVAVAILSAFQIVQGTALNSVPIAAKSLSNNVIRFSHR